MHTRPEDWKLGPLGVVSEEEAAWWAQHEPVVDAWLTEMEQAGDPWWQSAQHAASCLVDYQCWCAAMRDASPSWESFCIADFLFHDLHEAGTVGLFGSVAVFFDQLVEALRRFAQAGLIEDAKARAWLAELQGTRDEFLRHYGADEAELRARAT